MKLYLTYGNEDVPEGFEVETNPDRFDALNYENVEEVLAHHILDKHDDLQIFFAKLHKILPINGKATFQQFYFRNPMAWISPLTIRGISEFSLSWLSKDWREANKWASPNVDYDFNVEWGLSVNPDLETRSSDAKNFAMANYAGSVAAIQFIVTKK